MDEQNNVQNAAEEDLGEQMQIRREKLAALKQNGENPYECTSFLRTCNSEDIKSDFAAYEGKEVSVAGRIISRRMMGKASFSHLLDEKGDLQIYVKIDNVGPEAYEKWKKMIEDRKSVV